MILNLWSADQEGAVKIYDGGPRECSEDIQLFINIASTLHHAFSINTLTACVL